MTWQENQAPCPSRATRAGGSPRVARRARKRPGAAPLFLVRVRSGRAGAKTPVCLGLPRTATPPVRTHSPEAESGAAEVGSRGWLLRGIAEDERCGQGVGPRARRAQGRLARTFQVRLASGWGLARQRGGGGKPRAQLARPHASFPPPPLPRLYPRGARPRRGREAQPRQAVPGPVGARRPGLRLARAPRPRVRPASPPPRAPLPPPVAVATPGVSRRARAPARLRERSAAAAVAAPAPAARAATPLRSPLVVPGPAPGPKRGPLPRASARQAAGPHGAAGSSFQRSLRGGPRQLHLGERRARLGCGTPARQVRTSGGPDPHASPPRVFGPSSHPRPGTPTPTAYAPPRHQQPPLCRHPPRVGGALGLRVRWARTADALAPAPGRLPGALGARIPLRVPSLRRRALGREHRSLKGTG